MDRNDSQKIVENLVITNEIISRYKEPNSSLKVRDITFKNCILYRIDLYFLQLCNLENCIVVDTYIPEVTGCQFKTTILYNSAFNQFLDCDFECSSIISCHLDETDFLWTNFSICQFRNLKLGSNMINSCKFKLCTGDWESYINSFVMISEEVEVWNTDKWIKIEDWLQFLRLHGVKIDSDDTNMNES